MAWAEEWPARWALAAPHLTRLKSHPLAFSMFQRDAHERVLSSKLTQLLHFEQLNLEEFSFRSRCHIAAIVNSSGS